MVKKSNFFRIKVFYIIILEILVLGLFLVLTLYGEILTNYFKPEVNPSEVESIVKSIMDSCNKPTPIINGKEVCYSEKFEGLASKRGSEFSFKVLDSLTIEDIDAQKCHLIAHGIGQGAFKNNPKNWNDQIKSIKSICNYGAVHGVIQSYVSSLPGGKLTAKILPTICGSTPRGDCNHILGHLILVEKKADINQSLDFCDVFKDTTQLRYCYAGVFMENQTVDNLIEHGYADSSWKDLSERIDQIETMCRNFQGERAVICWEEIAYAAFEKYRGNIDSVFDFCAKSQVSDGSALCRRYALLLLTLKENFEIASIKEICKKRISSEPEFESSCYNTLASTVLVIAPSRAGEVRDFCVNLNSNFSYNCVANIGKLLTNVAGYSKNELEKVCKVLEGDYRSLCLEYDFDEHDQNVPSSPHNSG